MYTFIFQILPVIFLLALGILVGGYIDRRHLARLTRRELATSYIRVCNLKHIHAPESVCDAVMVMGQVVIGTDYFKTFVSRLRNLVGGEMRAAQKLLVCARREALLRLVEQAQDIGATEVWNVRFAFSNINQMRGNRGSMQVEMLAYGTAVVRRQG